MRLALMLNKCFAKHLVEHLTVDLTLLVSNKKEPRSQSEQNP